MNSPFIKLHFPSAVKHMIILLMFVIKIKKNCPFFYCDRMNNMIRVMVHKGLVTDLARIPHSLDLSSPNMSATVNAALKPLELVTRFVPRSSSKKKNTQSDDQQPIGKCSFFLCSVFLACKLIIVECYHSRI